MDPVKATAALSFTNISITSDGTRDGTKILLNGKEIKDLSSLRFSFYNSDFMPVSLGFIVSDKDLKSGTLVGNTYYDLTRIFHSDDVSRNRCGIGVGSRVSRLSEGAWANRAQSAPLLHPRRSLRRREKSLP